MFGKQLTLSVLIVSTLCAMTTSLFAAEYYVAKYGSDKNPGTREKPFLSIGKAAEVMKPGDLCLIGEGVYNETVRPTRSGKADSPIVFRKLDETGAVVISGFDPVPENSWKRVSDNFFKADVKMDLGHENQVLLGGQMLFEARWPNTGNDLLKPVLASMGEGTTPNRIVDSNLPAYDYSGAKVWIHAPWHWSNWTTSITGSSGPGELEIVDSAPFHPARRHVAIEGAKYFIYGFRDALDADNEWFYDADEGAIYIYREDGRLPEETYYIKRRMTALDLRGRSHIEFHGLDILGSTIDTDKDSYKLIFDSMVIKYPYFSSEADGPDAQATKGVRFMGRECIIQNSEIAYSSGTGVALFGENNQVLNCYIHDHNFIGTYASGVQLGGKGNVISHSTLTRSGRSLIDYGSMYQALIQYCELSYAGMLTSDLGLTYGNVIEGGNSEVRFNVMHSNQGDSHNMGLYYDHGTQNIISHHNIIYGVSRTGLQINHYAGYHLIYNNTFIGGDYGFRNAWGNAYGPELVGCRFVNNVFSAQSETTAAEYHWSNNITRYEGFDPENPFKIDEALMGRGLYIEGISLVDPGQRPGIGAIEAPGMEFKVGHDFDYPPVIDTTRSKPLHRNLIGNSAFEHEDHLFPWRRKGAVELVTHPMKIQISPDNQLGRMGQHSIALVGEGGEIYQQIENMEPNSLYRFTGHLRVNDGDRAVLGVRYPDGSEFLSPEVTSGSPYWRRVNLSFETDLVGSPVVVFVRRLSDGRDKIYFDDSGLVFESRL